MAQARKSRPPPSRMRLSPRVATTSTPNSYTARKDSRTSSIGPFGGLNQTDAGGLVPLRPRKRRKQGKQLAEVTHLKPKVLLRKPRDKRKAGIKEKSYGEQKALKMQKVLSDISYRQRTNIKDRIASIENFEDFQLLPVVLNAVPIAALKGLENISPTPIQRLAIPSILTGRAENLLRKQGSPDSEPQEHRQKSWEQYLLAAETGSGKTLAYLLPTIDAIKRAEAIEAAEIAEAERQQKVRDAESLFSLPSPPLSSEVDVHQKEGRPRAVVLLPTAELVDQVGGLFKSFAHVVKLRIALISASYSPTVIRNRLYNPAGIDILISTPHLLSSIASTDPNVLARVNHLIIDEADSLFDRSFASLTSGIIDKATPSLQRLILCSATIPRSLDDYLRRRFPDLVRLATPNLHAIPRRVQLSVVDVDKDPYRGNRALACADTIWSIGRARVEQDKRNFILVFVNKREEATQLAQYLTTKGVDAVALNRDTKDQREEDVLGLFTLPEKPPNEVDGTGTSIQSPMLGRRTLPNTKVLVLTDIGSRGIDTVPVRNVVLYDVPHTTIDFIHRLGRLGRMGRRGRGFVLVGKEDRKDVVREVRESMFLGKALI